MTEIERIIKELNSVAIKMYQESLQGGTKKGVRITLEELCQGYIPVLAKAIEQYVIKARIENLQWLVDKTTTIINGREYPELISKEDMRELIAELKKGIE